jgi:hypothetical protein
LFDNWRIVGSKGWNGGDDVDVRRAEGGLQAP